MQRRSKGRQRYHHADENNRVRGSEKEWKEDVEKRGSEIERG